MENVCASQEANCSWKFDSTNSMYILMDNNDRVRARIKGEYLINPDDVEPYIRNAMMQQTKDLWQHWSGVKNA